jgi:hypothetical protein
MAQSGNVAPIFMLNRVVYGFFFWFLLFDCNRAHSGYEKDQSCSIGFQPFVFMLLVQFLHLHRSLGMHANI